MRVEDVPEKMYAALQYSGGWNDDLRAAKEAELRASIAADDDVVLEAGPALWARHDPPSMPPFMRKNEVLLPVSLRT